jgi:hypothetical protein
MPMRVIAKKRCRAMFEPPEKGERATLNPNLSTRLNLLFSDQALVTDEIEHPPDLKRPSVDMPAICCSRKRWRGTCKASGVDKTYYRRSKPITLSVY